MTAPVDDFPCNRFVELVTDYLDDALSAEEHGRLEEHLAVCVGCASVLEQFRQVIRTTGTLAEDDVSKIPSDQREQVLDAFRQWAATRPTT